MIGETNKLWRAFKPHEFLLSILVALTFALSLTHILVNRLSEHSLKTAREEAMYHATQNADTVAAAIQRELVKFDVVARAVLFALEQDPDLSQEEYTNLVAPLIANSPSIMNVGRSYGYIVDRVYPLEPNRAALGLDYRKVPDQLDAVEHVMRTGTPSLGGPVELVQGGTAFVHRTPYFGEATSELAKPVLGIVSIIIDRDRLMSQISADHGVDGFDIAVRSLAANGIPDQSLYGKTDIFGQDPVLRVLPISKGSWQVGLVPKAGWPEDVGISPLIWVLSLITFGILGFLVVALWSMYRLKCITENQLRSAINSINDGFALYDSDDRLVFANEKYHSFYDKSKAAIFQGNSFENILREGLSNGQYEDAVGREEEWLKERLQAHRNPSEPVEQKLADGRWLKIAETRSPEGNTVGFRVDVTELKQAREKAEAANQAKNNFLNMISHELRTPLTSVIGYARFLEYPEVLPAFKMLDRVITKRDSYESQKRALEGMRAEISKMSNRIAVASDHLLCLINDILDLAKLDAQTVDLCFETLDLKELVKSVSSGLSLKAAEKGIDLINKVEPLEITVDAKRIRQALINVIGNAIKFTDSGHVSISSEQDETNVQIIVRDTGCGIRKEDQEKIFDQFVQVDTSVTRRNSGAGLGLSITRELLRLHGGDVTVSSVLGTGTTFTISIPLKSQKMEIAA